MARHRNVRKLDFDDEFGYDDVYGRSLEDEPTVSPSTAAQFLYTRESRAAPSLSSFIDPSSSGCGVSRSISEPYQSRSKPKPTTSPLASSSVSASAATQGEKIGGQPGFKLSAEDSLYSSKTAMKDYSKCNVSLQKGTIPDPVSMHTLSSTSSCIYGLAKNSILGPEGSLKNPKGTSLVKRVSTSSSIPRMGFVATFDDDSNHSTTPSPSLSPFQSPVSSPARSPSPAYLDSQQSFSSHITSSKHMTIPAVRTPRSRYQHIDVVSEYNQSLKSGKGLLNLIVIGHVDAGKSTLMGHLLYLVGNVSKRMMHKYEQESQKVGKSSFAYAWILDETGEERHRGITMDVAQCVFETETKTVTLLDAPGHKDFIPNMITGAAQADVALLVVNATVGEFEAGFDAGGQTREHALLVRSLGVRQIAVAINKMDTVEWSVFRFREVVGKLKVFLKQAGFRDMDITYVPCSGLTGENLVHPPSDQLLLQWYCGPTLLDTIDKFSTPSRSIQNPFRCCIANIFKGVGTGICITGKIESGHVQVGESVLLLPANEIISVKAITVCEETRMWAVAGDQVLLTLIGVDINKISTGNVLCSPDNPVRVSTSLEARVIVFDVEIPITMGFPVVFHYQSTNEPAIINKLVSVLNKSSGELIKKRPRCLTKNCTAVIQIRLSRPMCLEVYQECKDLGRFMLRSGGNTIAAGIVTNVF